MTDDHDFATGVWPDMREHGWAVDDWPDIFEKVLASQILVLAGPIWLGDNSSGIPARAAPRTISPIETRRS